jgi:hypothetical protein
MLRRYFNALILSPLLLIAVAAFIALIVSSLSYSWGAATTFATLFVGLLAAIVVYWQGALIKRQLAFSTYLDLDKEWNSLDMMNARRNAHVDENIWDVSPLEAILEFFEKLASLFKTSRDINFIYDSTLGWYAAHYFLYAREHGRIKHLRALWEDDIYSDLEDFYDYYRSRAGGFTKAAQISWETERLSRERRFWEQERKG